MKTAEAVSRVAARLEAAGIEDGRREARIILAAAMGVDAAGLLLLAELPEAAFEPLVARRAAREPLAYILGRKEFWGLEFEVSPATLIPRPDSETLIEAALAALPERDGVRRILDLGTGTGCLLLAALSEFGAAFGVGVDISPRAAMLAAKNARNLGFSGRCAILAGNWAAALGFGAAQKFDLILSNPPYIASLELAGLMPEVAGFEPVRALCGGPDGLQAYRLIIEDLGRLLAPRGVAVLELGVGQADDVAGIVAAAGLRNWVRRDLADIPRALIIRP
jgi:release factor glutamine methyltransferase